MSKLSFPFARWRRWLRTRSLYHSSRQRNAAGSSSIRILLTNIWGDAITHGRSPTPTLQTLWIQLPRHVWPWSDQCFARTNDRFESGSPATTRSSAIADKPCARCLRKLFVVSLCYKVSKRHATTYLYPVSKLPATRDVKSWSSAHDQINVVQAQAQLEHLTESTRNILDCDPV